MTELHDLQRRLVEGLVSGRVPLEVRTEGSVDGPSRFGIYARSRAQRLLACLRDDFPRVRALLGEARFDELARAYLSAHPPDDPMLRNLGRELPGFVASGRLGAVGAQAGELARFEWSWVEVFDAANVPVKSRRDLEGRPAASWPQLRFELAPHVRKERFRVRVDAFSVDEPERLPPAEPVTLLLWRRALRVYFRDLDPREARALTVLATGGSFAEICAALTRPEASVEEAAAQAVRHLARWLDDELIAGIHDPRSSE